jgi:predicted porin
MKKHLIAAAVAAAVAVPAMAQVTVSGNLDTGYATRDVKTNGVATKTSATGFANRGTTSTINFQAVEDLGQGLKATAFVNQALVATDGSMSPRDIWAAIQGGFGEVKIGRFTPAFETVTGAHNITGITNSAGTADFMYGASAGSATAWGPTNQYTDVGRGLRNVSATSASLAPAGSTIQYSSPSVGGFQVIAGLGKHTTDDAATAGKLEVSQTDIAVAYSAGPLSLGVAVVQREDTSNDGNNIAASTEGAVTRDIDLRGFGASYKVGDITLRAGMITRQEKLSNATTKAVDSTVTSVGATIPFGATSLLVNFYDGDDDVDGTAAAKRDYSGYQLGVYNALSKRTTVYALYGKDDRKGPAAANASERTDVTVGLRHSF